jgi:hypothetical protein
MANRSTLKSFLVAFLVTVVIAIAALVIELIASTSGSSSANGITVYAGGVSRRFVSVLVSALPVIFVAAFFICRRVFR